MMYKKTFIYLAISIFLISTSGCSATENLKSGYEIKGKFIFHALRELKEPWGIFSWQRGKVRKFKQRGISPLWSNDGKKIACVKNLTIRICDTKGNILQSFPKTKGAVKITWSPNNDMFVYTAGSKKTWKNDNIFLYNIKTEEKKKLLDFKNKYSATTISFSPKEDKILFFRSDVNELKNCGIYIYDLKTSIPKLVNNQGTNPSWFPDGKHILITTNRNEDWSMINKKLGVFMKINIETGEKTILRNRTSFIKNLKVSKDGKYFYYSKPVSKGGYIIAVSPIDNSDIEIPVTKPVDLGQGQGYSQDLDPDWYQGE